MTKLRNLHPNVRATARSMLRLGNKTGIATLVANDKTDRDLRGIKGKQAQAYLMACEEVKTDDTVLDDVENSLSELLPEAIEGLQLHKLRLPEDSLPIPGTQGSRSIGLTHVQHDGHPPACRLIFWESSAGAMSILDIQEIPWTEFPSFDCKTERLEAYIEGWLMASVSRYRTVPGVALVKMFKWAKAATAAKTPKTAQDFCDLLLRRKSMYGNSAYG